MELAVRFVVRQAQTGGTFDRKVLGLNNERDQLLNSVREVVVPLTVLGSLSLKVLYQAGKQSLGQFSELLRAC